ncbi:hypothetical protein Tco_0857279 [Tanacetum coccineum]|uniref:Uncharacterized protein n=1 Tax=Tanacetum coccineum TaxID=301880 RepID=A0ABQ5B8I1_9ASTR
MEGNFKWKDLETCALLRRVLCEFFMCALFSPRQDDKEDHGLDFDFGVADVVGALTTTTAASSGHRKDKILMT